MSIHEYEEFFVLYKEKLNELSHHTVGIEKKQAFAC